MLMSEGGGSEPSIRARLKAAWDKRMPRKIKVKLYETVVRPVILYGLETCALTKKEERLLVTKDMWMLRRIMGVTLRDRKRGEDIRKELKVCNIIERIRESRLRSFGNLERAQSGQPAKDMTVEGNRGRGRQRIWWKDNIKRDLRELNLTMELVGNRKEW
ncbi:uncharacterized protein LOC125047125 [Penaeus chinensis]|uniref:uncharacterized protein LOC125047125 n=1 Tax=Penaeus chinensis TaxID=139456 RepID=UPI001FB5A81E|nr:uncharacterized protein LOC125047125 [Penaeus chinensis]